MTSIRRSCWALVGVLVLGGAAAPPSMVVHAGTQGPIVDPTLDIITNAIASTQSRLDAYQHLATFLLTQFQFDVQQVVDTRREDRRIERYIRQVSRVLDKEARDAERDVKSIIKDAKRALRHTGGGGSNNQLKQLLRDRIEGLEGVRSQATAGMYDILAAATD